MSYEEAEELIERVYEANEGNESLERYHERPAMTQLDRPKLWKAVEEAPKPKESQEALLRALELESCQPSPYWKSPKPEEAK